MLRKICIPAFAVALLVSVASIQADQAVSFGYNMPLGVSLKVNSSDCDNSPGPLITLEGEIELGGLSADLILQNNVKGTHTAVEPIITAAVLLPAGGKIVLPKQPVLGGVGGNPWIYLQFVNGQGQSLGPEILLGRCVQGLVINQDLLDPAIVSTLISAADCSNNPGPWITFEGDIALSGLNARLIFRNNAKGTHQAIRTVEVALVPPGLSVTIPKQPVRGGVGGNPWIWVQYLDQDDDPIGTPYFLGRCSKM